ncbi:MAG TPA: hypothetical protein VIX42_04145 [Edaphobacter sp.]
MPKAVPAPVVASGEEFRGYAVDYAHQRAKGVVNYLACGLLIFLGELSSCCLGDLAGYDFCGYFLFGGFLFLLDLFFHCLLRSGG